MNRTIITTSGIVLTTCFFTFSSFSEGEKKGTGERPDLKKLDKNNDLAISETEAGPEIWARLGKLDKNNDGQISGDEFPRPDGNKGGPGENPGEFMKRLDKNGDGNISKDEAPEQAWERLSKMDKNGDDSISREEFGAAAKERMGMSGGFFENMDKNKDGKLTESEAPQAWERLSKADGDKDGSVTKLEAAKAFAARADGPMKKIGERGEEGGPAMIFEKFDADKDGKLSKEEVPAELWAKLSKADNDADGLVSKDELGKVYQKMPDKNPGNTGDLPKRPALEKVDA